jgi:RNA polymerase sigma-70 factor (ECF subfamily)
MKDAVRKATGRLLEQALVIRCQARDDSAFEELVEMFQKRLHYYVERLVEDRHEADDVVQDVWVDVYRSLPRLRSPRAFRVWLYRIARDKVYTMFRKRSRWMKPADEVEAVEDGGEEPGFSADDAARIHEGLRKLPPAQREVLTLRFIENMSYEEIAGATGCRLGTVRSRIHYAKQALRRTMEEVSDER